MTATTNKEILASFKSIEGPEDAITVFLPDLKRFCKAVHANYIIFEVLGTDDNEQVARLHADEKRLALNLDRIATTERTQQGSDDTVAEVNRRASGILAPPSPDREAPAPASGTVIKPTNVKWPFSEQQSTTFKIIKQASDEHFPGLLGDIDPLDAECGTQAFTTLCMVVIPRDAEPKAAAKHAYHAHLSKINAGDLLYPHYGTMVYLEKITSYYDGKAQDLSRVVEDLIIAVRGALPDGVLAARLDRLVATRANSKQPR